MGGPKLYGTDVLNTYTGRSDDGPLGIVVRADPAVRRVMVVTADGAETDLDACGGDIVDGLRFYVGVAWPRPPARRGFGLRKLCALDADATPIGTYTLDFWDRTDRP